MEKIRYKVKLNGKRPKGAVIPRFITESEANEIKRTGKYKYEVWPDHDSFHYVKEQRATVIKITTTTKKEKY